MTNREIPTSVKLDYGTYHDLVTEASRNKSKLSLVERRALERIACGSPVRPMLVIELHRQGLIRVKKDKSKWVPIDPTDRGLKVLAGEKK
ncbi:hypothetical protein I6I10_12370 [Corynebacterium glucuronolyticum]|uniref:Uncharacterized protein n=1 Tax=Corynebacterium glucuronolyticum TaxID=39791 RepID=A0A7T4EF42_9CORY|nr:hypothetical protein [Corynebacterium glucuronolyticum]QQB46221.1 hypothetical protein I6I10_12370 [Corynebacterium glucuronolyticum]WKD63021.1 hypothetical protein CGLUCO_03730 [Corynebacterium glucuronolyticum DSM 44120]SMB85717.1 hypothetical protein SAMN05660745_01517 [Corynebacterium glucuronolyticum]